MITKKTIYQHLRTVIDPELNINIVDLGLIYDVKVRGKLITITVTLTSPGCPLVATFQEMIRLALQDLSEEVEIILTFDPPWLPDMMSEVAKAELGYE